MPIQHCLRRASRWDRRQAGTGAGLRSQPAGHPTPDDPECGKARRAFIAPRAGLAPLLAVRTDEKRRSMALSDEEWRGVAYNTT